MSRFKVGDAVRYGIHLPCTGNWVWIIDEVRTPVNSNPVYHLRGDTPGVYPAETSLTLATDFQPGDLVRVRQAASSTDGLPSSIQDVIGTVREVVRVGIVDWGGNPDSHIHLKGVVDTRLGHQWRFNPAWLEHVGWDYKEQPLTLVGGTTGGTASGTTVPLSLVGGTGGTASGTTVQHEASLVKNMRKLTKERDEWRNKYDAINDAKDERDKALADRDWALADRIPFAEAFSKKVVAERDEARTERDEALADRDRAQAFSKKLIDQRDETQAQVQLLHEEQVLRLKLELSQRPLPRPPLSVLERVAGRVKAEAAWALAGVLGLLVGLFWGVWRALYAVGAFWKDQWAKSFMVTCHDMGARSWTARMPFVRVVEMLLVCFGILIVPAFAGIIYHIEVQEKYETWADSLTVPTPPDPDSLRERLVLEARKARARTYR